MDYSEEELLMFIERHDEHEDYYRGKLAELRALDVDLIPDEELISEARRRYPNWIHNDLHHGGYWAFQAGVEWERGRRVSPVTREALVERFLKAEELFDNCLTDEEWGQVADVALLSVSPPAEVTDAADRLEVALDPSKNDGWSVLVAGYEGGPSQIDDLRTVLAAARLAVSAPTEEWGIDYDGDGKVFRVSDEGDAQFEAEGHDGILMKREARFGPWVPVSPEEPKITDPVIAELLTRKHTDTPESEGKK